MKTSYALALALLTALGNVSSAQRSPARHNPVDEDSRVFAQVPISETRLASRMVTIPRSASRSRLDEKVFSWPELSSGDCKMLAGAKLTLRSDGTASWSAVTKSTDSNDEWDSQFNAFASNGFLLFIMPTQNNGDRWYFNKMKNSGQDYSWNTSTWIFDPSKFTSISTVTQSYKC